MSWLSEFKGGGSGGGGGNRKNRASLAYHLCPSVWIFYSLRGF